MVLAAPGPLLTPPPSSSPPKTPHRSYSAQTRSQDEEKNPSPKPYLPPQTRTRHRRAHRPHVPTMMRGNTPPTTRSPPHQSCPTGNPPNRHPAQSPRKNGAGEARRRVGRRRGRPPSADRTDRVDHATTPHQRQTPPSTTTHPTTHIFTNDPHYRKPAHSLRRAPTGGHPRRAATVRGRPPGDARRQPRVRLASNAGT